MRKLKKIDHAHTTILKKKKKEDNLTLKFRKSKKFELKARILGS